MRFDGHVKITGQALRILTDLTKRNDVPWSAPTGPVGDKSTAREHWMGVLLYINSPFAGLPELVAGVSDISEAQSHFKQNLQRMHFMRATEDTEHEAFRNGVAFIISETEAWIRARMETFWERGQRKILRQALPTVVEKGIRVDAHLAKALHCLQDSFSPGHVLRTEMDGTQILGTAKNKAAPGCFGSAPPIRRIFDYNHPNDAEGIQAKGEHDENDYYAGSLAHAVANTASYASAELIQIALNSIVSMSSNPREWTKFVNRWLTFRADTTPNIGQRAPNMDLLLRRTSSPAKMSCGRRP